ncbi:MAG: hypothetical protein WDZ31_12780 [Phycisphaeraceae bacterium]
MATPYHALGQGDYGSARVAIHDNMVDQRDDRQYILDRMRTGILTLADGHAESAQTVFEPTYDMLRTQGINRDRTVASIITHEGVRIWKGEPFEQALTMLYYGLSHAQTGSWDNARAAAQSSLFQLRDFRRSPDEDPREINTREIARRSLLYERAVARGATADEARAAADYLDHGYVARNSNFTLGYLLNAVANQQLARPEEAHDNFNRVLELDPDLEPLVEAFRAGQYNTVLVVSWGLGPRKTAYGPDDALARFLPRYASTHTPLRVRVGDADDDPGRSYGQVLDVNQMARDHRWNNLEDIRMAKSTLGTGLLYGGALTTAIGADRRSERTAAVGLGLIAAGLLTKSGAAADTRYCDVMPQRVYVVPLNLDDHDQPIQLQVEGIPASRLVLRGLTAPGPGEPTQLRYVRLVSQRDPRAAPPRWATAGQIRYSNPHTGATSAPNARPQLPYILGGHCVRPPRAAVLRQYHQAGHLLGYTVADLAELYRLEDIYFAVEDEQGYAGRHVLEGGRSLVAPQPGTTGFMRLFGVEHAPYRPTSREVADAARDARQQRQRASVVQGDGR